MPADKNDDGKNPFRTFDLDDRDVRASGRSVSDVHLSRAYQFFVDRARPLLPGDIANWLDQRLDVSLLILRRMCEMGQIRLLSSEEKKHFRFHELADAYIVVK